MSVTATMFVGRDAQHRFTFDDADIDGLDRCEVVALACERLVEETNFDGLSVKHRIGNVVTGQLVSSTDEPFTYIPGETALIWFRGLEKLPDFIERMDFY